MKKLLLLISILLVSHDCIHGQSAPSAAALSASKIAETPINLSTGVAGTSIALSSISDGPLSVPVSLDYNGGGVRVSDVSSPIGLGWSLNTGAIITRTVKGIPDDHSSGYLFANVNLSEAYKEDAADGFVDSEPDIFTFAFPGFGGKFIFDEFGNPITLPLSNLKIDYEFENAVGGSSNPLIDRFIITDNQGIKYYFGQASSNDSKDYYEITRIDNEIPYKTSWFLYKIESLDKNHTIELDYTESNYSYTQNNYSTYIGYIDKDDNEAYYELPPVQDVSTISVRSQILTSISSTNQSMNVSLGERLDLAIHASGELDDHEPKKIDLIEFSINNNECVKYTFDHDYFEDSSCGNGPECKKLRLNSFFKSSCNNVEVIPETSFEYYGSNYFPNELSKSVDHWGYYNAANNDNTNMIQASNMLVSGNYYVFGNADRLTNPVVSNKACLKKINFPTGGYKQFNYESNEINNDSATLINVATLGTSACGQETNSVILNNVSANLIATGTFGLSGELYEQCSSNHFINLTITNLTTGNIVNTYSWNNGNLQWSDDLTTLIPSLTIGHDYELEIVAENSISSLIINESTSISYCGGLRIKSILLSDGDNNSSNDIVKSYSYLSVDNSLSSGILAFQPKYVVRGESDQVIFSAYSHTPLANYSGSHITYERVVETLPDSGSTIYEFEVEAPEELINPIFPLKPEKPNLLNGFLLGVDQLDEAQNLVASQSNTINNVNDSYITIPGLSYVAANVPKIELNIFGDPNLDTELAIKIYSVESRHVRIRNSIKNIDGVFTNVRSIYDYTYTSKPSKLEVNPSHTSQLRETVFKYTGDYSQPNQSNLKTWFQDNNVTDLPYVTRKEANINNSTIDIIVDEVVNEYQFYNNSTGVQLADASTNSNRTAYPSRTFRLEKTWDENENLINDGFEEQISVNYHDPNNAFLGLKYSTTKPFWNPNEIEYNANKTVAKTKFNSFEEEFVYYPNSTLIETKIEIDGAESYYVYDDLMRLKTVTSCNGSVIEYFYEYNADTGTGNRIRTVTTYPADQLGLSDLTSIESIQYFDGLNRSIQSVAKYQGPSQSEDIVSIIEYDDKGRAYKSYYPFAVDNNNGAFVDGPSVNLASKPSTQTEYSDDPLSRVVGSIVPDFGSSAIEYGSNPASEIINYQVTGNPLYIENALYVTTSIDGNGNKNAVYTDKLGRRVLSRQVDVVNGTEHLDTYYVYDEKDRLKEVIPPGSTKGVVGLNYFYLYDSEDRIIEKKIPGVLYPTKYVYGSNDLLIAIQDAWMVENGNKWMGYQYDDYGREVKSGFVPYPGSIVFDQLLTEEVYGSSGMEVDKIISSKVLIEDGQSIGIDGNDDFLISDFIYGSCGELMTSTSNSFKNFGAQEDVTDYYYDGAYNVVQSIRDAGMFDDPLVLSRKHYYDFTGRSMQESVQLNNFPEKIVSQNSFDERNNIITFSQGNTDNNSWLQETNYSYFDNGSLKEINEDDLTGTTLPYADYRFGSINFDNWSNTDLFYQKLFYSQLSGDPNLEAEHQPQFNGNISGSIWQSKGKNQMSYLYHYDQHNRLIEANHFEKNNLSQFVDSPYSFDASYDYDKRGNFTHIERKDFGHNYEPYTIPLLYEYEYEPNTNQLLNGEYDTSGNINPHPTSSIDGSNMSSMDYNRFNLPTQFSNNIEEREYDYDANGNMLRNSNLDFVNGLEYQYKPNRVVKIPFDGGYIIYDGKWNTIEYNYVISDYLGNVRVIFNDKNSNGVINSYSEVINDIHYFPYGKTLFEKSWNLPGLEWEFPKDNYTYNGIKKESLDGNHFPTTLNFATYRTLDPKLGTWLQVDPKAEATYSLTPYGSMNQNPISYTDPEGDVAWLAPLAIAMGKGAAIGVAANGINNAFQGNNFFAGAGQAAAFGALGGGLAHGIGLGAQALAGANWGPGAVGLAQAGSHGISGGIQSELAGGSFGSGFLSGAASSGIGSLTSGWSPEAQLFSGITGGGLASMAGGGSFIDGATQGAINIGLNHLAHQIEYKLNMMKASNQQVIDKFKDALQDKKACFECGGKYTPLNLEDYFRNFPEIGGTHMKYSGEMNGVSVDLELPVRKYNRTKLDWGGPGWQSDYYHGPSGQYRMRYIYPKFGSKTYPLWNISFPLRSESIIRSIPGI